MKNTIEIKSGKMQFNVKTGKEFRDTLAKWHDADFELADKILAKNDRVKSYQTMIDTDRADLERLDNGSTGVLRTREEIVAEIEQFEAKKAKESADMAEYRKAQVSRYEGARALCTKVMFNAYEQFVTLGTSEAREEYKMALAQFFADNGFEPANDTLELCIAAVGKKKNSARNKVKTGKHNGAMSYNAWRDIFLGEICDVMGDAIPVYKFAYVLKEQRTTK